MPTQETALHLNATERAALQLIWLEQEASRIMLADRLGMSRAQATNIVRALMEKGLVAEAPNRDGGRGQPVRRVTMAEDGAFAIGVKVWRSRIEIGLLNSGGKVEKVETLALDEFTVAGLVAATQAYRKAVTRRHQPLAQRIVGVGFSFPGYFNHSGEITQAYFPQWDNLDIASVLQPEFDIPVLVENDGACAAWGEHLLGAAKGFGNFLFLDVNYGVGGGVVIGRRLLRGAHGNAGVFGVPFPVGTVRPSGQDLMDTLRDAGFTVNDLPDMHLVPEEAQPVIEQWIERAADQLQPALGVLAGAFDPEAIVIGGAIPPHIIEALVTRLDTQEFCAATRKFLPVPLLRHSTMGTAAGMAGAAALALGGALFPTRTY